MCQLGTPEVGSFNPGKGEDFIMKKAYIHTFKHNMLTTQDKHNPGCQNQGAAESRGGFTYNLYVLQGLDFD